MVYAPACREERQGRRPVGHRPCRRRSVFDPRRVVIIGDLAATLKIFPVPALALILWRTFELLLGDVGAIAAKAGVILEGVPGDRIGVVTNAHEAAKAEHSIGHLAAALFDHDALDGPHLLALGIIDSGAFYLVAADEVNC